jgi:DNA polymerase-3 subunit alpha
MQHADFVPLHLHTEYSLLDGAIKIDELIEQAVQYKMPALAVTDHGNIFGAVEFYRKAVKAGIKPIIGCEIYVAPNSRFDKSKVNLDENLPEEAAFHLILLAKDKTGYRNLAELLTKAYLEGFYYKPRIDKDLLEQYSGGLIGLTACLKGEVPYYLHHGNRERAREVALQYKHILGPENFYFEIQSNGLPEQEEVNRKLIDLADELHIPLVATNDCHYLRKEDVKPHDILLCIQTGKMFKDTKRMRFETEECYFKSPDEMKKAFREVPEAVLNTVRIAERCTFEFDLDRVLLPRFDPPGGKTPDEYLGEITLDGLRKKFGADPPPDYLDRLTMELGVIKKMDYASYFLIVWDFISYAKQNHIPVGPGRGSAAGSLVAYALEITELDPIKYHLLFERFLNPERISMPDIDVDFCKDRRQEVINYVAQQYGKDHVAQIITFGTMAAKAAIRDVGRVLDIPYAEVDRIAKLVPGNTVTIEDAIKLEPQLRDLCDNSPTVKELLDVAKRLEGISRHASTHAAGVVIAPEPLTAYTALYKHPAEEVITTQFDMGSVERIGLLKFDFLGLKTLTILDKTLQFIKQQGSDLVLSKIPLDDSETYRLLGSGESTGIFQLESAGMRDVLVRMQPNRFEDLMALVALYRPGPMGWIDDFIKRKKGETEVTYELPQLREILQETYGIILYQEQVMMIANKIANFSMGQADLLRRAMGKKKPEEMERQKESFIRGAVANKIPEKKAADLFEKMEPFAKYGFNKSHSAAYAYVAYQTAYLKRHYPVEFMAANLSADMGDTDRIVKLINECRHMALTILPPDINESEREFTIVQRSIRFGLEAVKGVGSSAIESIIDERKKGRFTSFEEFLPRTDTRKVNKKVIESLVKAGAFDSLYGEPPCRARSRAVTILESPAKSASAVANLFADPVDSAFRTADWDEDTLLAYEREALGFYVSGHPLLRYRKRLSQTRVSQIDGIEDLQDRGEVSVAGMIRDLKSRARDKGVTAYVTLEDESGSCELLVFPDVYRKAVDLLTKGSAVVARGLVSKAEKGSKVIVKEVQSLNDLELKMKYDVLIPCDDAARVSEKLRRLRRLMEASHNGKDPVSVTFRLCLPEYCVVVSSGLQPSIGFISGVQHEGGTVKVL